jgi:hypothetical protein
MTNEPPDLEKLDAEAREKFAALDALQEARLENAQLMVDLFAKVSDGARKEPDHLLTHREAREWWNQFRNAEMQSERLTDQIRAARRDWKDARDRHRRLLRAQVPNPALTRGDVSAEFYGPAGRAAKSNTQLGDAA